MGLEIRGAGGHLWEITRLGRGKVLSLSQGPQHQNTTKDDRSWSASDTQTPTGAGDYFFYMRNDSGLRRLVITRLLVRGAGADIVNLVGVTGTPAGGTTLAPLNRTVGSPKQPLDAVIQSGVDITGLTSTGSREVLFLGAAGLAERNMIEHPVVVPQGSAIALVATTGTSALQFLLDFYEDLSDPQVVVV